MRQTIRWPMIVAVTIMLLAGCGVRASAQMPISNALQQDAEAYAEAHGISVDEAIWRLQQQNPVGELGAVLREQESDVYAGLWIEHEPQYRVVVLVTEGADRIRRRYIRGGPLANVVEVRDDAEVTEEELDAIHVETRQILEESGSRVHTGTAVQQNCIAVYAEPGALQSKLDAASVKLPEHTCMVPTDAYPAPPPLDPPPGIVFPRQHPPESLRAEMTALLIGELIEVDGCLRVQSDAPIESDLVIWPYDHTIIASDTGTLQVHDGSGAVVAAVGDMIRMGGGQVPKPGAFTDTAIPDRCSGPYWIAGSKIEVVP